MVKEKNRCMNFVKGICCIAVILSHCSFPNKIGNLITYPLKIAVPFFFMISGYFAYHKNNKKIFHKAIHILKLLLVSEIVYIVYFLIFDKVQLMNNFNEIKQILKIVFVGTLSTNNALWFLYALFWSYLCLMIINKFKVYKLFHVISIIVLVLHVIIRSLVRECNWYDDIYFRNFLLFGLPFVLLGSFIKKHEEKLTRIFNNKMCIVGELIGEVMIIVEYLIFHASDYYIGTIITTFFVFLFTIKNPKLYVSKILEFIGDKLSMYVYIFHMLGLYIINLIANLMNISNNIIFRWSRPILVIIFTLGISYLIYLVMNKSNKKELLNRRQEYGKN